MINQLFKNKYYANHLPLSLVLGRILMMLAGNGGITGIEFIAA
jgi:hypothetical protein